MENPTVSRRTSPRHCVIFGPGRWRIRWFPNNPRRCCGWTWRGGRHRGYLQPTPTSSTCHFWETVKWVNFTRPSFPHKLFFVGEQQPWLPWLEGPPSMVSQKRLATLGLRWPCSRWQLSCHSAGREKSPGAQVLQQRFSNNKFHDIIGMHGICNG